MIEDREIVPRGHIDSPYQMAAEAQSEGKTLHHNHSLVIGGERRMMDIANVPLERGTGTGPRVVGFALDQTELSDLRNELSRHRTAHNETLDELTTAVAIFNPDQHPRLLQPRLCPAVAAVGGVARHQAGHEEMIEALREKRRLPEQADFRAWKQRPARSLQAPDRAVGRAMVSAGRLHAARRGAAASLGRFAVPL